jgi:hypothetical protein
LTEDQLGGTAAQPEAGAFTADQSTQPPVGTVAVADEPATPDAVALSAPTDTATEEAPAPAESEASAPEPDATAASDGHASATAGVSHDELADAPAAADDAADEDADHGSANGVPEPAVRRAEPTTMAELLAEQDADIKSFKHGDVVEGTVVRID